VYKLLVTNVLPANTPQSLVLGTAKLGREATLPSWSVIVCVVVNEQHALAEATQHVAFIHQLHIQGALDAMSVHTDPLGQQCVPSDRVQGLCRTNTKYQPHSQQLVNLDEP